MRTTPNHNRANPVTLLSILALSLVCVAATASGQQTFNVVMTADNAYAIYAGDAVSATSMIFTATNLLAADIWSVESFSMTVPDISYVYIVGWSDDSVIQGLLADFENITNGNTVLSGDPLWEVTATGIDLDNGSPPPTLAGLTTQIGLANLGTNPSGGWVPNTPSLLTNGAGGIHPNTIVGIDANARWMWYDSGLHAHPDAPFKGFNHEEYLIFRTPVIPEPATMSLLAVGGFGVLRKRKATR